MLGRRWDSGSRGFVKLSHDLAGHPHDEAAIGYLLAFGDQGARPIGQRRCLLEDPLREPNATGVRVEEKYGGVEAACATRMDR